MSHVSGRVSGKSAGFIPAVVFGLLLSLPAGNALALNLTWDVVIGDYGVVTDGYGVWSNSFANWNNGSDNTVWNNSNPDFAIIGNGGGAGVITVDGTIELSGITFNYAIGNYVLQGGLLIPTPGAVFTVDDDYVFIHSIISGNAYIEKAGPGKLILTGSNTFSGGAVITVGALAARNDKSLGTAPVILNGGALSFDSAGLYEGRLSGSMNTTSPNPKTAVQLGTPMAHVNAPYFGDNTTWVYTGYLVNNGSSSVTWTFGEQLDDSVRLTIDGIVLLNNGSHNTPTATNYTLTPGFHEFEARFGNGTGGAGPVSPWTIGFGYDTVGRGTTDHWNFVALTDPGNGSLLCHDIAFTNSIILSNAPGNIIDVPGPRDVYLEGIISGPGGFNKTGAGMLAVSYTNLYEGQTTVNSGKVSIAHPRGLGSGNVVLNGGTLAFNIGGLYEGRLSGVGLNSTGDNPMTGVTYYPRMAHTRDAVLFGDYSTWVYSGFIRNGASTNVTWTFGENLDDVVLLKIDGETVLNNGNHDIATAANYTLTPGTHAIDLRIYNGAGGAGAYGVWTYGVAYDVQGRGTTNFEDFAAILDPGDGSLLSRYDSSLPFTNNIVFSNAPGNVIEIASSVDVVLLGTVSGSGGFSKTGTGTVVMAGMKTYTGNTIVQCGTLTLSNAYLNANSDVYIYSPGRMTLNFEGRDSIRRLYINGVQQPEGSYSSANMPAYFSGTGYLWASERGMVIKIK